MDEKCEKKWRDNWFYKYLVGEKGRMELVGLGYFLPRLTKMFSSWIEDKTEEKTITKNLDQKAPVHSSNHVKAPMQYCNVSFFFFFSFGFFFFFLVVFSLTLLFYFFYFLSFSTFLLRLLSFSGTFHSFDFFFFFSFVLVSFFLVHHIFVSL